MGTRLKEKAILREFTKRINSKNQMILKNKTLADIMFLLGNKNLFVKKNNTLYELDETRLFGYLLNNEKNVHNFMTRCYVYSKNNKQPYSLLCVARMVYEKYLCEAIINSNTGYPKGFIEKVVKAKENRHFLQQCVLEYLNKQNIFLAISKNPRYATFNIIKAQNMISDIIPENLADLYPMARSCQRTFYLHVGDTNSGKTYESFNDFLNADSGIYLSPLRLLAMENQEKANNSGVLCSLLTGEEDDFIEGATHISSTIEMLSLTTKYDVAIIDEAQMIQDKNRGWAWTRAILGVCANRVHVCMSENALEIVSKLILECGDTIKIIRHKRNTPLVFEKGEFSFPKSIRPNDALIVFSRKNVLAVAEELRKNGIKASKIYGALPYDVRKSEVEKFLSGETSVIVSTDAIGMGMNLPIERVVFLEDSKFDGEKIRKLQGPEVKQIAGRAGRKGMFEIGYVNAYVGKGTLRKSLNEEYCSIQKARTRMPDELLELNKPLEEIMKLWSKLQDKDIYEHSDIEDAFIKNSYIEEFARENHLTISNKERWKLINLPIDSNEEQLFPVWIRLMECYCLKTPIDYELDAYTYLLDGDLASLEMLYRVLDGFYAFQRIGGDEDKEFKDDLVLYKREVSNLIMEELAKSNEKICKYCGKPLAWSHKYAICDQCYTQRKKLSY